MTRNRPQPSEITVEVVLVDLDSDEFSGRERCLSCEQKLDDNESVFRLSDHVGLVDFYVHRRCIEFLFKKAPVDGDTAEKEFKRYRAKLVKRYTP